ncbi:MAG: aminoacyl-tRNA hydrolase [Alphaproteobacteria bacterium]
MLLFVGLGNPGAAYAGHRHNVGFMAADAIAAAHGFGAARKRFRSAARDGFLTHEERRYKVLLLKPMTYMNESGRAVGEAVRYFDIPLEDVVVFHDELDLAPGKIRVKTGGGAAGHNGIRSLTAHIGANFRRVRIGIGHPGAREAVQRYALSDFAKGERQVWVDDLLDAIADAAPYLAAGDDAGFMNRVALKAPPPKPIREEKKE